MSLVTSIKTKQLSDIINQGLRLSLTGSIGSVTDGVIQTGGAERAFVVTGITLSTDSATSILVSLGFKGDGATAVFFSAYVIKGGSITVQYPIGDEKYSDIAQSLVVTTNAAGPVVYSIDARLISEKTPLGYIQYPGCQDHHSPWFPSTNADERGVSRF